MLATAFLGTAYAENGSVETEKLADLLQLTRLQLASAAGLSRDAVSKTARLHAPATQARLRDMIDILNRTQGWAGSPQMALAWYRSQPLPGFGDLTAEDLVKQGRAEAVKRHLSRIAEGGFA